MSLDSGLYGGGQGRSQQEEGLGASHSSGSPVAGTACSDMLSLFSAQTLGPRAEDAWWQAWVQGAPEAEPVPFVF